VILAVTAAAATAAAVGNVLGPAVGCKASGGVIACNRINNIYIYIQCILNNGLFFFIVDSDFLMSPLTSDTFLFQIRK
jgi:hypothetical protein